MLYISFLFFTLPTYLLLYDLLHTPIPVFSYRFFAIYFIGLVGWQMGLVRTGRYTGVALGGHLRQGGEKDEQVLICTFVTMLFSFSFRPQSFCWQFLLLSSIFS